MSIFSGSEHVSTERGHGHETQQRGGEGRLTSNLGVPIADDENSLKSGSRGPTLLEDFLLREKIFHFDHERIPERIVHARGSGAYGYFEATKDISHLTRAAVFQKGKKTPIFARMSTVAGGAGSVDTPRDVRGFALKFYTDEGNWDLVGNNIPVFFIQDAIKFPDLVHALRWRRTVDSLRQQVLMTHSGTLTRYCQRLRICSCGSCLTDPSRDPCA